ncbi:MAG: DegT/DnrJ/EryC1/StrS family aminotransferase [Candidatus Dormibacteria bacterium]
MTAQLVPRYRLALPDVGEEEIDAIRQVLSSGILTNGPMTARFEEVFASRHQVAHGVALANGTVALAAIYLGLGIGPGDEVIVPSMTFISSATSVLHVGATPVFADVDRETFTLSTADVAKRVTSRTRAILAVHYGGQAADLDELRGLADGAGIDLIEDAAQAHGASYHGRPVGGFGRAAMFSFTPTKNITTGEGGMVTTDDGELAERIRLLRNHGQSALYQHTHLGFNWRITEMQAAMGVVQMGKLDSILERKRNIAATLSAHLGPVDGVVPPLARTDRQHVYMLYTTLMENRDEVRQYLLDAGVEARLYFPPVHQQQIFRAGDVSLPTTEYLAEHMLSLPIHSRLGADDVEAIADLVATAQSAATSGRLV